MDLVLPARFSSAKDVSFWVTPESSCDGDQPSYELGEEGQGRCL